jgi:hypothetical protein
MLPSCRVALVASLCCCLAAGATARAQERTTRLDVTHCYVAEAPTIEFESEYWVRALLMRGTTRAAEPGGSLDGAATRCFGTRSRACAARPWRAAAGASGPPPRRTGCCSGGASRGAGATACPTSWAARAATGAPPARSRSRCSPPIPSLEPGLFRACARSTGEFELP